MIKMRLAVAAALLSVAVGNFAFAEESAKQLFKLAKEAEVANDFVTALGLYLKADSAFVAEDLDNTSEYAQSLHNTGMAYLNTNNLAKGREFTMRAAELREKLDGKVSKDYITSLNNYALSFLIGGEPENALKYQTEVIALCRQLTPSHPNEGKYLVNLGRIHHALNDDATAVKTLEEALPKVEKFSKDYEVILSLLGDIYIDQNDNANANRILSLMEEHDQHELENDCDDLECHLSRAEYFMSTGSPAKAKDEFMVVFAMPLTYEQKATANEKYALFLYSQGDYAQSGDYYILANDALGKSIGISDHAAWLLIQGGRCYYLGKEYDKALEVYEKAIETVEQRGYSETFKGDALEGIANAYRAKKDYDSSINAYGNWIGHLKSNGHEGTAEYAKAYERLASAEKFKGDYDASLADYDTAIDLYGKLEMYDEQQQAIEGKNLCLLYARNDSNEIPDNEAALNQRRDKIRRIIQESLNSLEQGGDYLGKLFNAQTFATIAEGYAQLEDYHNAVEYYGKYIPAIREAIAEDFLLKSPKEREQTWRQELKHIEEMNSMIALIPQDPALFARLSNLIYDGQLLSKGILLSSDIEFEKVLERQGSQEMRAQYSTIKNNIERIATMRQEHKPLDEILALTRATDAMQLSLARESAQFADFMNYLRLTSSDVLSALGEESIAIEFVTLKTGLTTSDYDMAVAVVLSKEFPSGILLPISYNMGLREIMADNGKFAKDEYGEIVWGRLSQILSGKKKVYFAPDGLLNNIGIEYLSVNGRPMSEHYEVARLSSTREIARNHQPQPLQYAALFGGIDYLEQGSAASDKKKYSSENRASGAFTFANLENTRREVDAIETVLKKNSKKTFKYTGAKASKAEFLSQDRVSQLGLLHIATHGKFIDSGNATEADAMGNSILAFAGANLYPSHIENKRVVTAAEIAEMSLSDCGLVVLSACESGLGKLGSDGVFGLQRGFKNAGVKSMLVSLNEVADVSTADMMIAFYSNLFSGTGATKREALRKAQNEIRAKYPDDNTWASFILIDAFD